ncbi:MAG: hypothetical protein MI810_07435 [Flavobacteriales bacterium]|nr:hypothetical protein [Flavobacteriales bacterium]
MNRVILATSIKRFLFSLFITLALVSCKNETADSIPTSKSDSEIPEQDSLDSSSKPTLYTGQSSDSIYSCDLLIEGDSSVIFVVSQREAWIYTEYRGEMTHLKDSIYKLDLELDYGHYICRAWRHDSLQLLRNPNQFPELDSAEVWYKNGTVLNQKVISDDYISYPIPIDSFYRKQSIYVDPHHQNPITNEALILGIPSMSSSEFIRGEKLNFELFLSKDKLYPVDEKVLQFGNFELTLASTLP